MPLSSSIQTLRNISFSLIVGLVSTLLQLVTPPPAQAAVSQNFEDQFARMAGYTLKSSNSAQVIPATGDFTVELWAKAGTLPSNGDDFQGLFHQGVTGDYLTFVYSDRYGFVFQVGSAPVYYGGDANRPATENRMTVGRWDHYALVVQASNVSLYQNGNELLPDTGSTLPPVATRNTPAGFAVGNNIQANFTYGNRPFNGDIDQVKVWNRALTQAQVLDSAHTYANGNLSAQNLISHWDFNGSIENRVAGGPQIAPAVASGTPPSATLSNIATTSVSGNETTVTVPRSYLVSAGGYAPPAWVGTFSAQIKADANGPVEVYSDHGPYVLTVAKDGSTSFGSTSSPDTGTPGQVEIKYLNQSTFNLGFTELDFSFSKVNHSLSCYGTPGNGNRGKTLGDVVIYEGVIEQNGVSVDAAVYTKSLSPGVSAISRYEVGARASKKDSYFLVDIAMKNKQVGYGDFYFRFYVSGSIKFQAACNSQPNASLGIPVTLRNVYVTGIDIDGRQYSDFSQVQGYTLAQNTRLAVSRSQSTFPMDVSFTSGSKGGNDLPIDQATVTYGQIEEFEIRMGTNTPGQDAWLGVAFAALSWGSSTPVSVGDNYQLNFDANGASGGAPAAESGAVGADILLPGPAGLTKAKSFLSGWNTKADGSGIGYSPGSVFPMPLNGATLYAQWERIDYSLLFDNNGGTGSPDSLTAIDGVALTIPVTTPSQPEFTFAGWNTEVDGSGTSYSAGDSFVMPESNDTLFAQWTQIPRNLTYDINTGTVSDSNDVPVIDSGFYQDEITVSDEASWFKANHSFKGWNTMADGSGSDFASGGLVSLTSGSDTVLYAQWQPDPQKISFNGNGGNVSQPDAIVDYGASYTTPTAVPLKTGHTFQGWNTLISGTGTTYSANASIGAVTSNLTLYAQWLPISYSVSYVANLPTTLPTGWPSLTGNATTAVPTVGAYGSRLTLADIASNTSNYRLLGWNTQADGSGDSYQTTGSYRITADFTLFGQWAPADFEIAFSGNGGSGAPAPADVAVGSSFTISGVIPIRTGYEFSHWSVSDLSPTGTFNVGDVFSPDSNELLVAQYNPISYTLEYNSRGGSAIGSSMHNYLDPVTLPSAPNRSGFQFVGWNTQANGQGTMYAEGGSLAMPAENTTLYAIWTGKNYPVIFWGNGGSGAPTRISGIEGETLLIPSGVPTRRGFSFAGWNTLRDGTGDSYGPGQTITLGTSRIRLFAQWSAETYELSFDTGDGTAVADIQGQFSQLITLPSTASEREGHEIERWNEQCDGSGRNWAPGGSFRVQDQDMTLCAIWRGLPFRLSFDVGEGRNAPLARLVRAGQDRTLPSWSPGYRGYSFVTWNTDADGSGQSHPRGSVFNMPTSDVTLHAIWTPNTYNIRFLGKGAKRSTLPSPLAGRTGQTLTLPSTIPTRAGHNFVGWNDARDGSGVTYSQTATIPGHNLRLFAQWQRITYDITFDANQGIGEPSALSAGLRQQVTIPSTTPTKAGHWFAGWNTKADGTGRSFAGGQKVRMPLNGLTLYAIWINNTFQVSFNANGGEGGPAANPDVATIGSPYTIPSEGNISREGHAFAYWTLNADGTGTSYSPTASTSFAVSGNTTFYAQWSPQSFTLSYDVNGGYGDAPEDVSLIFEDPDLGEVLVVGQGTIANTGSEFVEWNTAADGSGESYSEDEAFEISASDVTLYAQWEKAIYSVEFLAGQANNTPTAIFSAVGSAVALPSTTPTLTGFEFNGWVPSDPSLSTLQPGQSFTMTESDLVMFASFSRLLSITPPTSGTGSTGGGSGGSGLVAGEATDDANSISYEVFSVTPGTLGIRLGGSDFNTLRDARANGDRVQLRILSEKVAEIILPARVVGALRLELVFADRTKDLNIFVEPPESKLNAGSFKGFVALYAKGYEGFRLSAKIGRDWVIVPALGGQYVRVLERVGAGYRILVRIYIERKLLKTVSLRTR
jgi:uncharacterized repeat protein (TIGR02543 family)